MKKPIYPSDEYDSRDLELEVSRNARRRWREWHDKPWSDDDDDDLPPTPVAARRPRPTPPLGEALAA